MDGYVTGRRQKKIIVIAACLSRVVIVERWLLRLFVVSAALGEKEEEEESGYRRLEGEKQENQRAKKNKNYMEQKCKGKRLNQGGEAG